MGRPALPRAPAAALCCDRRSRASSLPRGTSSRTHHRARPSDLETTPVQRQLQTPTAPPHSISQHRSVTVTPTPREGDEGAGAWGCNGAGALLQTPGSLGTARASSTTLRLFIPTKVYIIKFICYKPDLGGPCGAPRKPGPSAAGAAEQSPARGVPAASPGERLNKFPFRPVRPDAQFQQSRAFPLTGGSTPAHGLGKSRRAVLSTSLHADNGGDVILHRAPSVSPGSSTALCQGPRSRGGAEPRAGQSSQRRFRTRSVPWRAMNHCHAPVGQGFYSSITFAFLRVGVSLGSRVHETNWKIFLKTVSIKNKTHKTGKKTNQSHSKGQGQHRPRGGRSGGRHSTGFGLSLGKHKTGKG